jgi:FixJ family two-component response regulator
MPSPRSSSVKMATRVDEEYAVYRPVNDRVLLPQAVSMESTKEMVYIVDDDPRVREALSSLLRASGKGVRMFSSGQEFLDFRREDSCACLILDLKMPGLGGLEVQRSISAKTSIPVIFITGRGDIPSTVTAMKGGATDFLTKPVDEAALLASVDSALQQDRVNRKEAIEHAGLVARYESLTPREREVLPLLVSGLLNKQAAFELGITEYTVQIHRGHIMRKMEADSFATLVKVAAKLKLEPTGTRNRNT